jgi:hypothetical protein
MSLELLCNELLLYIFEVFDRVQLFRAFCGQNYRFDGLFFAFDQHRKMIVKLFVKNICRWLLIESFLSIKEKEKWDRNL